MLPYCQAELSNKILGDSEEHLTPVEKCFLYDSFLSYDTVQKQQQKKICLHR